MGNASSAMEDLCCKIISVFFPMLNSIYITAKTIQMELAKNVELVIFLEVINFAINLLTTVVRNMI